MPNTSNRSLEWLDAMSDDELRHILQEDASKPAGEDTDMELILHVMEVLAKRRNNRGEGKSPAQALDSFNQNYCTTTEYHLISERVNKVPKIKHFKLFKRFATAAAVLVLFICFNTISACAWDFDLLDIIANWTQETFHFGYFGDETKPSEPVKNDVAVYVGLQGALDTLNITTPLIPSWIPEGYTEIFVDIQESPLQRNICASYQYGEKEIIIQITDYLNSNPSQVEQSSSLIEVYESNGITYYIFENNGQLQAIWINKQFECCIAGTLSLDEIKLMIDSIGEG